MSLLPATSHANPTTPFWLSALGGARGVIIIAGNTAPVAWFKNFDVTPPDNILDIQTVTLPKFNKNGKVVVQLSWNINSGGQDADFFVGVFGNYINVADPTSIQTAVPYTTPSLTFTFDYIANTTNYDIRQRIRLDSGSSPVDVGGTATWSVMFYPEL